MLGARFGLLMKGVGGSTAEGEAKRKKGKRKGKEEEEEEEHFSSPHFSSVLAKAAADPVVYAEWGLFRAAKFLGQVLRLDFPFPFLKPTQNPTPNRPELETDQRGSAGVCLHSDSRKNSELRKHIRRFQNNRTAMRVAWIKNKRRTTSKRALALQIEIESNSRGAATAQLQIRSRSEPRVHSNHRYQRPPRRPDRRFDAATPRTYRRQLWTFRVIQP